jgi:outer membrane protein assembly factor BamB
VVHNSNKIDAATNSYEYTKDAFFYSDAEKVWKTLPEMNETHFYHRSIYLKGDIYVIDGNSCEKFNFNDDRWSVVQSIPNFALYSTCLAVANNRLFVVKGEHRSLHVFDKENNAWVEKREMPSKCKFCSCATYGDDIFVVGYDESVMLCLRYDTSNDTWTVMNLPTSFVATFSFVECHGSHLLISISQVEEYDPINDAWHMTGMPAAPKMAHIFFGFTLP